VTSSTFKKKAARIWLEHADMMAPPEMEPRLAAAAWRAWSKVGSKWPSALARGVSRAMEEARLFGGDPLTLLVARPMRMMSPRPRGRVRLYPSRERLAPEQLAGFGFPPSETALDARHSTGT